MGNLIGYTNLKRHLLEVAFLSGFYIHMSTICARACACVSVFFCAGACLRTSLCMCVRSCLCSCASVFVSLSLCV